MERRKLLILSLAFEGGMLGLALLLGAFLGPSPFATWELEGAAILQGLAATVPLLALLPLIEGTRWRVLDGLRRDLDRGVRQLFARCRTADLAVISLLAGIGEEALFRGVIQPGLSGSWGPAAGLAATAAIFGLAHAISRTYAVYAALMGLYLGALLMATGNILAPVMVHALYDFVALTWLVRRRMPAGAEPLPGDPDVPGRHSPPSLPSGED